MKWKPIIISVVVLMILIFGGVFYYASYKINGEELRKFMISSLESALPYAEAEVGEVRIKFGSSLNLEVQGISLKLVGNKSKFSNDLFKVERVGIEIPLWIILGLEQSITVNLKGAFVNFVKSGGMSNWNRAHQGDSKNPVQVAPSGGKVMAPAFLTNGKVNIKFTDTRLNYNLEKEQKGEFLIKYFQVNNLGIESHAAYEIKSDISLEFYKQAVDMKLSLIGQFDPAEFMQQGTFKTTSILTVNEMYFPHRDISVPGFKTDINLELSNTGDVNAKLETTFNEKNYINMLVKTRNKELLLEDLDLVFYLDEWLDVLKMDMPSLRPGNGRIEIKGDLALGAKFKPNIIFFIGPQIKYSYNNILFSSELKGKYQDDSLVMGLTSKGLNGSLYGDFSVDIDIGNRQPIVLSQLPPFKFSIVANDLVVPSDVIQSAFYAASSEQAVEEAKLEKKIFLLPQGVVDFNLKNISLGGKPLSLMGSVTIANRKLESKEIKITTSDGEGIVSFQSRIYREGVKSQFAAGLNNVNLKDFSGFFPKNMGTLEGVSSVNVKGMSGNLNKELTYNANLQFEIKNGHWHGMNLTQYTQNIVNGLLRVPSLGRKLKGKKLKISNKFQEILFKGVLTHDRWNLDRYSFVGRELSFKGNKGRIYLPPTKKKSALKMEVDLKSLRTVLSKNFAQKKLPLRLTGVGFTLKPDISFVSKKLAQGHIKKRSKKLIRNLKNKVIEDSNKNIKGILKSFL